MYLKSKFNLTENGTFFQSTFNFVSVMNFSVKSVPSLAYWTNSERYDPKQSKITKNGDLWSIDVE